jgi:hypothetical protein
MKARLCESLVGAAFGIPSRKCQRRITLNSAMPITP